MYGWSDSDWRWFLGCLIGLGAVLGIAVCLLIAWLASRQGGEGYLP